MVLKGVHTTDSDGDGLSDLEETGYPMWIKKDAVNGSSIQFYKSSSPMYSVSKWMDSDNDGIPDTLDVSPRDSIQSSKYVHNKGKELISYDKDHDYSLKFDMNYK